MEEKRRMLLAGVLVGTLMAATPVAGILAFAWLHWVAPLTIASLLFAAVVAFNVWVCVSDEIEITDRSDRAVAVALPATRGVGVAAVDCMRRRSFTTDDAVHLACGHSVDVTGLPEPVREMLEMSEEVACVECAREAPGGAAP